MTTTRGRADWREADACAHADPGLFFPISSPPDRTVAVGHELVDGSSAGQRPRPLHFPQYMTKGGFRAAHIR
jgi:hypothetical protein